MKHKIEFYRKKMEISTNNGEVTHYYCDLMYVKYDNPFCWLHFSNGVKYKVEISLTYLLSNIPKKPFFKCNRSSVINICFYKERKEYPSLLIMIDGTEFKLSSRNKASFQKQKLELKRISPPCPPCLDCKKENCPDLWLFCLSPCSDNDNKKAIR